jgi:transposase
MAIVGGFDVHRQQITFDYLDTDSGEVRRGQVRPATRESLRKWLERFSGRADVAFAVEGCTGWRFVVEELQRVGLEAHLAEPADTAALRGKKKRAKTDRADARHQRELLATGRLPESWIAPGHVLEWRARGRLYVVLMADRRAWSQRIHATLFHHGAPAQADVLSAEGRGRLAAADLSPAAQQRVTAALTMIDHLDDQIIPLRAEFGRYSRQQPGCRALRERLYGIGSLTSVVIWAEMGDTRRFSSSRQAVRHTGLDVTVHSSDGKRSRGRLSHQGPPTLRWALFEAAQTAARASSPDHDYYRTVRDRQGANRAALSVCRRLACRVHHTLRELGDEAWVAVG